MAPRLPEHTMSDLFDWNTKVHHHSDDVATSVEAAESAAGLAQTHARKILHHLRGRDAGACQIAAALGMEIYQVRRRLTDLKDAGLIARTGGTVKTPSGRSECVWAAV